MPNSWSLVIVKDPGYTRGVDPPVFAGAPNGLPCENAWKPEYIVNTAPDQYAWYCSSVNSEYIGKYGTYPVSFTASDGLVTRSASGSVVYSP